MYIWGWKAYMAFNFNYCVLTNGVTYQIKVKVKFICNSSLFFLSCNKTAAYVLKVNYVENIYYDKLENCMHILTIWQIGKNYQYTCISIQLIPVVAMGARERLRKCRKVLLYRESCWAGETSLNIFFWIK